MVQSSPIDDRTGAPAGADPEPPSGKRALVVYLPLFATERLVRIMPEIARQPFASITEDRGRLVLVAVNPQARRLSLRPGMVLADARALAPDLQTRFANPVAEQEALEKLAHWCMRYTPIVMPGQGEGAEGQSLFLDISGCAHLFGGEERMAQHLCTRLVSFGLTPHVAIADTPGAAWARALVSDADAPIILPPFKGDSVWEHLADCPVASLRLDGSTTEALISFGLRTIGALRPLSRRDLADRFGAGLLLRLGQLLGVQEEAINPLRVITPFVARQGFFDPIATPEDIAATTRQLLDALCHLLEQAGQGAVRLVLSCHRVDGTTQRLAVGMARPSRWPEPLFVLLAEKLGEIRPDFGIEIMELAAPDSAVVEGDQTNWQDPVGKRSAQGEAFAAFVNRLGNRYGFASLARQAPAQSWLPERAVRRLPPFDDKPLGTNGVATNGVGANAMGKDPRWPGGRPRPLRLLMRPEAVDAIAPVPDDPPVQFRWQGRTYRVRAADGPERLSDEWWGDDPDNGSGIRDYYTVEDEDGRRYWLYRDGLYKPGTAPQWFLHGLFG